MTMIAGARCSQILSMVLALVLAAPSAFAAPTDPKGTASLRNAVKTGDVIAVTRWSGGKVKGQVVEATECSVVLRAAGKSLTVPNAAVKTVRRYPPAKQNHRAEARLDVVEQCDQIGCAPAALAVVGLAALFHRFQALGRQPKVVYRGKRGHEESLCH